MFTYSINRNVSKIDALVNERKRVIKELIRDGYDSLVAAIKFDSEIAEVGSDRQKFKEYMGVSLPTMEEFNAKAEGRTEAEILEAKRAFCGTAMVLYAMWGSQVVNWKHLSDEDLFGVLQHVLSDTVRIVGPTTDCTEYIDLSTCLPRC